MSIVDAARFEIADRIEAASETGASLTTWQLRKARFWLSGGARADFYVDLATHLDLEARLTEALTRLFETATRRGGFPPIAAMIADLLHRVTVNGGGFGPLPPHWMPMSEA